MAPTNPPSDATNVTTLAALRTAIQAASGTSYVYIYTSPTNQVPTVGTALALNHDLRDSLDLFSGKGVFTTKIEFLRGADVYNTASLTDKANVKLAQDTTIELYSDVVKTNQEQLFWKVAAGTYAGKYIAYEEIRPPHSSL